MKSLILEQYWSLPSLDFNEVERLARASGLPLFIACLLFQRGIRTRDGVARHLTPRLSSLNDPFLMADMAKAVERLRSAVVAGEKIAIFGDYDADGVTGSALVYLFLKDLGLSPVVYIPHRETEGYGLNPDAVKKLSSEGCSLVVTVDCGISCHEEIKLASQLGMDVIVTDHHEPPPVLPPALAVVNPKRVDCPFPFKGLAGVGVAFNLVRGLRSVLYQQGFWSGTDVPNLKNYLDLVALGTVADMVPLLEDNRILVKTGLEVLEYSMRPGIRALKKICQLGSNISTQDIGFRLAPRLNAAGRMAEAEEAFKLLVTPSPEEAESLASRLHQLNQERQSEEAKILRHALKQAKETGPRDSYVLYSDEWKRGVVGIVASKMVEQLKRPVILLAVDGDMAYGSGRGPDLINLYEVLCECRDHLTGFGGHKAAAGLRLPVKEIGAFQAAFEASVKKAVGDGDFRPVLRVDFATPLEQLFDPGVHKLFDLLEPFGAEYPEPLLAVERFRVRYQKIVGKGHLKLTLVPQEYNGNGLGCGVELVGWGHGDKINLPWERMEIVCRPFMSEYQGQRRFTLQLKDARFLANENLDSTNTLM